MKVTNIAGYSRVEDYVKAKLDRFSKMDRNFKSLFTLMFSEEENVLFEEMIGVRIKKTTYKETRDMALRKAVSLSNIITFPKGSNIGIHLDNSLDWIVLFWSILISGYNPVLFNTKLNKKTLEEVDSAADVKAVISDTETFSVPTIKTSDIGELEGAADFDEFGTEIIVMSSGTSDSIKICGYTIDRIYHQIEDSVKLVTTCKKAGEHFEGEMKFLTFLPFYHIFGLFAMYIWFAFFSRTFVKLNDMSPDTIKETIRRHKVTHIFAVPLFFETVHKKALRTIRDRGEKTYSKFEKGLRLSLLLNNEFISRKLFREVRENMFSDSVRFMITGGAPIKKETLEFFNAIGYRLCNGYGMSEVGITSFETSSSYKRLCSKSVGLPFKSVEYRINDNSELEVRSLSMASYVIENGIRKTYDNEFFNTHDIASFKDGRYEIGGRIDDIVIGPSGENLNPNIIEGELMVDGILNLCLLMSDKVTLIVSVSKYLGGAKLEKTKSDLWNRIVLLGLDSQIGRIIYTKTPLISPLDFKVNRKKIKKLLENGELEEIREDKEESQKNHSEDLLSSVREIFARSLSKDLEEIDDDSSFYSIYEGSSLEYYSLLTMIDSEFGISIDKGSKSRPDTVNKICEYIEESL